MAIQYSDQFYKIDPANPPLAGVPLNPAVVSFVDTNEDGFIGTGVGDTFNGLQITAVWADDTVTVNVDGQGDVSITGVTFYLSGGPAVFTPTDGTVLQSASYVSSTFVMTSTHTPVGDFGPTCFTLGAEIETPGGPRRIETLGTGDLVTTMDHGAQPLLWIGRRSARAVGVFAPVRFAPWAIGNRNPVLVSQQHRMLVTGWQAQVFYGLEEVFVAAKHLVNGDTIRLQSGGTVEYFHLLFARHEVVIGDGIPSESFFPRYALTRTDVQAREEITALFPDIPASGAQHWQTARPVLRRDESSLLGT